MRRMKIVRSDKEDADDATTQGKQRPFHAERDAEPASAFASSV
ncbi:MAG TPA: hypothetical protein VF812_04670 [Ktedonobacterales bacterium]